MPKRKRMEKKYKRRRMLLSVTALFLVGAFGWFLGQRGSVLPEAVQQQSSTAPENSPEEQPVDDNSDESASQPEEQPEEQLPATVQDIDLDSWKLAVSAQGEGATELIYETCRIDSRIAESTTDMINAARLDGIVLIPHRGYAPAGQGATADDIDHATGLAIDFTTGDGGAPVLSFADTQAYRWLNDNAYKYGFVLRFGEDKEASTGLEYQPWHFRFVGEENAIIIRAMGYSLEEYRTMLEEERSSPDEEEEDGDGQEEPA